MLASSAAAAEGEADEAVHKVLKDRTATFCKAVLPAWFASKRGIHEPGFRAIVVDCYLGQARLAVLGTNSDIALEDTALPELPARLLGAATGMNLDNRTEVGDRCATLDRLRSRHANAPHCAGPWR